MNLTEKALDFANRVHCGMVRKGDPLPYILHPMEAAVIVSSMTRDQNVIAAALLHDVVEDANITPEELEREFGSRVAGLVASETENKRENLSPGDTWMLRKQESVDFLRRCDDIGVKMLYLGDKLSNVRAISRGIRAEGDAFWQRFCQKDPEKHHWYYRSICDATAALCEYPVWQEFNRLICELFCKGEDIGEA